MEELANKLSVPLETIDQQTRMLLENLTKQLGLVARQGGPLEDRSIPPELREQRSSVPPELREQISSVPPELREQRSSVSSELRERRSSVPPELRGHPSTSIPPELRSHQTPIPLDELGNGGSDVTMGRQPGADHLSQYPTNTSDMRPLLGHLSSAAPVVHRSSGHINDLSNDSTAYCTSYPPPDIEENQRSRRSAPVHTVASSGTVTVDYSHGRARMSDTVTSESILASLQTDLTSSMGHSNGEQPRLASLNSSSLPLKDKVRGFTHNVRMEIGSRPMTNDQQSKAGNGFIPRQLQSRPITGGNVFDRPLPTNRPIMNQGNRPLVGVRPNMGSRPAMRPSRPQQTGQTRKW